MLKLDRVSKFYSSNGIVTSGFSKVSLDFQLGEFVAITGESGSGKSTLLNVISGLDSYEEGEMYIFGQPTSGYSSEDMERYRKRYIGNIFQTFNLVNNYTVYQNVELVLLLAGYTKEEVRPRVNEIIEAVGMTKYRKTKASKLSGGQKQRVAIARALAKDTPIIVADEPTGNLDVESAKSIIQLLAQLSKNRLILIVTHNYEQVEPYISRQITMHDGKVVEDRRRPNAAVYQSAPAGTAAAAAAPTVTPAATAAAVPAATETPAVETPSIFDDDEPEMPDAPTVTAATNVATPAAPKAATTPAPTTTTPASMPQTGTESANNSLELSALELLSQIGGMTETATTPAVETLVTETPATPEAPAETTAEASATPKAETVKTEPAAIEAPATPVESKTETTAAKNTQPKSKATPEDFHEARNGKLSKGNTIRLGIRNAFSLPAKLCLLLVVFLFLTTGTFSAYTSYKNNQRSSEEGHYSQVFRNADASRLVLLKKDRSAITQDDLAKLRNVENVKTVDDHDLILDYTFTLSKYQAEQRESTGDDSAVDTSDYVTVSVQNTEAQKTNLTAGRKPENEQEAVLLYMPNDSSSKRMAESMLDTTYRIDCDYGVSTLAENMEVTVKIVGIAEMTKEQEEACLTSNTNWIQGILCAEEPKLQELYLGRTCASVYVEGNANGNLIALGYSERSMYPFIASADIPKGSILIPDTLAYNYPDGNAKGKSFNITATRKYESKTLNLTVSNVYNERNYKKLTGYTGKYEEMSQGVYMNPEDIKTLFQQGTYQVSVLVDDTMSISETESTLRSMGYSVLNVQKSAGYQTRTISVLSNAMNTVVLVILLIVLYFINYLIIKLIYKSRNVYFSTVRMLGGSHKDCRGLLLVDMLTVAHLAFILCIAGLLAVKNGLLQVSGTFETMARFVDVQNAAVLYVLVIILSILLARRYSKQIFKKTAMNAYKEEV